MRYINRKGELKDEKIVVALRKAAAWYENGEIQETYDLLLDIIDSLEQWIRLQEEQK